VFFALTYICFGLNDICTVTQIRKIKMKRTIERTAEFVFLIALLAIPMFFSGGL